MRAADPNALWEIVHGQCVPNQQQHDDPAPCAMVALHGGVERGYAVLKDLVGATQFLLIPTARVSGIESLELLASDAPNYFAAAWRARIYVDGRAHRTLPRESLSLAINSMFTRSQDQLHIHIDCIRADVRDVLREHAAQIGEQWAPLDVPLAGRRYRAMRVLGEELGQADPFKLLADGIPGAKEHMGQQTLVVTGATFTGGRAGFIILNAHADLAAGDRGFGEALQHHACALADASSSEDSSR
jgi:CDP-diacylglycerol pyrophosphatase